MWEFRATLRRIKEVPPRPGRLTAAKKRQLDMGKFGITFSLPPVGSTDVASRELSVTVNDGEPVTTTVIGQGTVSPEIVFNADDKVSVVLTDVDGHGNRSQPSAPLAFTVTDDVAPVQPGDLAVASKRQIDE